MKLTDIRIKLILSFLLATLLAGAVTVQAGNIALPDPEKNEGSITIHKYSMENVPTDGPPAPGDVVTDLPDGASALSGIDFTVTRVQDDDDDPETATAYSGPGTAYEKTFTTNGSGIAEFKNLPLGIYKVVEEDNVAVKTGIKPFLVSIPMTHPEGNSWLYDVHVYPKNELNDVTISIDKFVGAQGVRSATANIGDTFDWHIYASIPDEIASSKEYIVTDDLAVPLTYTEGSVEVYLNTKSNGRVLVENEPEVYTVDFTSRTLTVTFNAAGRTLMATALTGEGTGTPSLEIVFETTLNQEAAKQLGESIYNDATLSYTSNVDRPYEATVKEKPEIHTGGLSLLKIIEGTNTPLEGAVFKIYPTEADARTDSNAIQTPFGEDDWEIITISDGTAIFEGLAYDTYWLVETVAPPNPDGQPYNLLPDPVEVIVNNTSHLTGYEVANSTNGPGFVLPATGGTGTLIFTIIGIALIVIAGLIIIISRRNKADQTGGE